MNIGPTILCNQIEDRMEILEFVEFLAGFELVTLPDGFGRSPHVVEMPRKSHCVSRVVGAVVGAPGTWCPTEVERGSNQLSVSATEPVH
jgi:hypothetical protein